MKTLSQILQFSVLTISMATAQAQVVSIPDPALNAVILSALGKAAGPLTVQDLLSLTNLDSRGRGVTSLEGLGTARNLTTLNLGSFGDEGPNGRSYNYLTNLSSLSGLTSLTSLILNDNQLLSLTIPGGLTSLARLDISGNQLTNLSLPQGLTSLTYLDLSGTGLTNFCFLIALTNLTTLNLDANHLTSLTLPAGLANLTTLSLFNNELTNLTLPPEWTRLIYLDLRLNPLMTFVLPAPQAVSSLAATVLSLKIQGVSVYTYPLGIRLISPQRTLAGAYGFTLAGPPAVYTILSSTDLVVWNLLETRTNTLGILVFTDQQSPSSAGKFYRATAMLP